MGRLLLVRHAQASFLSDNYDRLSSLGVRQARLLGDHWARHKFIFDRVWTGPAARHRRTAEIVRAAFTEAGLAFGEPATIDELDEFDGEAVLEKNLPGLLACDSNIRQMQDALENANDDAHKRANFQRLFEAVISRWVAGQLSPRDVESWPGFCERVNQGINKVLSSCGSGRRVVIFTSGGPLAVAVQRALHLTAADTLQVAWMSRNCAFSEFLFSGDRFTLSSFNAFPHLDDESLLTYR